MRRGEEVEQSEKYIAGARACLVFAEKIRPCLCFRDEDDWWVGGTKHRAKKKRTKRPRLFEAGINPLCKFLLRHSSILLFCYYRHFFSSRFCPFFFWLVSTCIYRDRNMITVCAFNFWLQRCYDVTCMRVRFAWNMELLTLCDDCHWCVPLRIKIFHCSDVRPIKTQTNFLWSLFDLCKNDVSFGGRQMLGCISGLNIEPWFKWTQLSSRMNRWHVWICKNDFQCDAASAFAFPIRDVLSRFVRLQKPRCRCGKSYTRINVHIRSNTYSPLQLSASIAHATRGISNTSLSIQLNSFEFFEKLHLSLH